MREIDADELIKAIKERLIPTRSCRDLNYRRAIDDVVAIVEELIADWEHEQDEMMNFLMKTGVISDADTTIEN